MDNWCQNYILVIMNDWLIRCLYYNIELLMYILYWIKKWIDLIQYNLKFKTKWRSLCIVKKNTDRKSIRKPLSSFGATKLLSNPQGQPLTIYQVCPFPYTTFLGFVFLRVASLFVSFDQKPSIKFCIHKSKSSPHPYPSDTGLNVRKKGKKEQQPQKLKVN